MSKIFKTDDGREFRLGREALDEKGEQKPIYLRHGMWQRIDAIAAALGLKRSQWLAKILESEVPKAEKRLGIQPPAEEK